MKIDISLIQNIINYTFKDKRHLERAFTHSSMKKADKNAESYERMEFLGDAILDFIVAEHLYLFRSSLDEGEMTALRAKLVAKTPLCEVIFNLGNDSRDNNCDGEGIARYVRFGNGSNKNLLTDNIRADLFESIVAAIYLDGGMDNAKRFVLENLKEVLSVSEESDVKDYRSRLQEYCAKSGVEFTFIMKGEHGRDNEKIFDYEVLLNGVLYGDGTGSSKKLAQQFAAKEAILRLKLEGDLD